MKNSRRRTASLALGLTSVLALAQPLAAEARPLRASDLLITIPRPQKSAALRKPPVLDLQTLVGRTRAQAAIDHLLMQDATFATRQGVELDALEKRSWETIWSQPFDEVAIGKQIAAGRRQVFSDRDRFCFSNLANWRLRAVRFSPMETGLAGTPQDWNVIFGKDGISRVIELRFVFGSECVLRDFVEIGDAGVHVTYRLDPSRRGLPSPIEPSDLVEKSALANDQVAVRAAAQTYAERILAAPYRTWWGERVADWKTFVGGLPDASSSFINTAPFRLLDAARDPSAADESLAQIVNKIFSGDPANFEDVELGWPSLADGGSPTAQQLRAGLLRFVRDESTLHSVTTFSLHDFESWTFGKLSPVNTTLVPVELHTYETRVRGASLKDVDVVVSSSVGFYDNAMEFDASNTPTDDPEVTAGFQARVPDAGLFLKNNFTLSNKSNTCSATPADPYCSVPMAGKLAKVNTPARTNASNATCSSCHLSLTKSNGQLGIFPGSLLEMLTGTGPQLNVRTSTEIEATLSALK